MKDGRGLHMLEILDVNRSRIREYMKKNPDTTKKEIGVALSMSPNTVRNHVRAIEGEGNET